MTTLRPDTRCECGAPVALVLVLPDVPTKGTKRRRIPLDVSYDPAGGLPPSHALSTGRTTCRPLDWRRAEQPAPHETSAMTHFATCPLRRRAVDAPDLAAVVAP